MAYPEFNELILKQIAQSLGVPAFLLHPARGLRKFEDPRHFVIDISIGQPSYQRCLWLNVTLASGTILQGRFDDDRPLPDRQLLFDALGKCVPLELLRALRA